MKRIKYITVSVLIVICLSLIACGGTTLTVNTNSESVQGNFGEFTEIGNYLYYDNATHIIYIKNITYTGCRVYTPYYAPNGLPYKYNPTTNTFEEIEK